MAFIYAFTANVSVVVGNPTKASEMSNVGKNTDALKERFVIGHFLNNTATLNEDGFHKADYNNPTWFMAKATGNSTVKYLGLWIEVNNAVPQLRYIIQGSTANPANATAGNTFAVITKGGQTPTTLL
jgi:hypothetical protein